MKSHFVIFVLSGFGKSKPATLSSAAARSSVNQVGSPFASENERTSCTVTGKLSSTVMLVRPPSYASCSSVSSSIPNSFLIQS